MVKLKTYWNIKKSLRNTVIKQEHFTEHQGQRETLDAFPLTLQYRQRGGWGSRLSPLCTVQGQPEDMTGVKESQSDTKQCQRVGTADIRRSKDMEKLNVKR